MRTNGPFLGANTSPRRATTGQSATCTVLLLAAIGCESGVRDPVDLVAASGWEPNRLDLDPLREHAPADVRCPPSAYHVDGVPPFEGFEVTTGDCNFMAAHHPALQSIDASDPIEIVVWHLDLDATAPGPAHAAISIDGRVVWELVVDAPAKAELYTARVDAPADADLGAPIVFHLHNHGTNEWNIQSVRITNPD